MKQINTSWQSALLKFTLVTVIALVMLLPLSFIRGQVDDRSENHQTAETDISQAWGGSQTFSGPWISYTYKTGKAPAVETVKGALHPDSLKYVVSTTTKNLHRSIFDIPVYTAEMTITGNFVVNDRLAHSETASLVLNMDQLKGLQGNPTFTLGGEELEIKSGDGGLWADLNLSAKKGVVIPFAVSIKVNGSKSLFFRPIGHLTEVEMTSDFPDPSFTGDFLPVEREVREDGFTAKWEMSQITMEKPSENRFGVKMVKPVTQYRQTERALKYGLLVIFLVFLAGFVVELVSGKPINIIQYLVIGASLVLFYTLLLAFSDFLSFGIAYLIAAVMTTGALCGYFIGIVKSKWAFLLAGLVAVAYGVIYVLLQLENFAFLAGTLVLFLILCIIMLLTRNLKFAAKQSGSSPAKEG